MKIVRRIEELNEALAESRRRGKSIGFVPTMGFLHEGHLSLIRTAKAENDIVVTSVFVNPTQFSPTEDFAAYPRDLDRDAKLADGAGADIVFAPESAEIYPDGFATYVEVIGSEAQGLCAASRPSHFRGVTTVVAKLFAIVNPRRAYFGQKDYQQLAVVKRMVKDLAVSVDVRGCPTVRESDNLAMSSRNTYLTPAERQAATVLFKALKQAEALIGRGERSGAKIVDEVIKIISDEPLADLDYAAVRETTGFTEPAEIAGEVVIAVAVRFGRTRLIDNIVISC